MKSKQVVQDPMGSDKIVKKVAEKHMMATLTFIFGPNSSGDIEPKLMMEVHGLHTTIVVMKA